VARRVGVAAVVVAAVVVGSVTGVGVEAAAAPGLGSGGGAGACSGITDPAAQVRCEGAHLPAAGAQATGSVVAGRSDASRSPRAGGTQPDRAERHLRSQWRRAQRAASAFHPLRYLHARPTALVVGLVWLLLSLRREHARLRRRLRTRRRAV
jgi:hypothetical protein